MVFGKLDSSPSQLCIKLKRIYIILFEYLVYYETDLKDLPTQPKSNDFLEKKQESLQSHLQFYKFGWINWSEIVRKNSKLSEIRTSFSTPASGVSFIVVSFAVSSPPISTSIPS